MAEGRASFHAWCALTAPLLIAGCGSAPPTARTATSPGIEVVYFASVGETAIVLACYDARTRSFRTGAECLEPLPPSAELWAGDATVRVTGRATFTCEPTGESFAGVALAEAPPAPLLVWSSGVAGLVHGPAPTLRADLDGDGRLEVLRPGPDSIVLERSGELEPVSDPRATGTYELLGAADATGDGRLQLFYRWDYGHGWGVAASRFEEGRLEPLAAVACGS
jgi:hypothetical protein